MYGSGHKNGLHMTRLMNPLTSVNTANSANNTKRITYKNPLLAHAVHNSRHANT